MKRLPFILLILLFGTSPALAETDHHLAPYKSGAELEKIKALAGDWTGMATHGEEKPTEAKVTYRVTSNGSAVIETLFPGTAHEMVSMYHEDKGKLVMTHYCGWGNQPEMELKSKTAKKFDFDFTGAADIDPKKDQHMHAMTLSFVDDNAISHSWVAHADGKPSHKTTLSLQRAN